MKPLKDDEIKLNVDGVSSRALNSATYGGLLRNSTYFFGGFVAKLEEGDELSMKPWACML